MPMYNLLEYSKNYRKATGSLWKYCRDEPNNPLAADYNADSITILSLLNTKAVIQKKALNENQEDGENTEQVNTKTEKNLEIVVPLKLLSNSWRSLDRLILMLILL